MIAGLMVLFSTLQWNVQSSATLEHRSQFSTHVASNLVAPMFFGTEEKADVILRIERVSRDFRRKGFFRVAALPFVLVEGVELDIRDASFIVQALDSLPTHFLKLTKKGAFNVKGFSMTIPETNLHLNASTLRFADSSTIDLSDVKVALGGRTFSLNSATLHLRGEKAGHLVSVTANTITELNLLVKNDYNEP